MYLFLAIFWGLLGLAWIVWHNVNPGAGELVMRWTNVSAGWLALALAVYNLVRWWSRQTQARQNQLWQANIARQQASKKTPAEKLDPTFDFQAPTKQDETPGTT